MTTEPQSSTAPNPADIPSRFDFQSAEKEIYSNWQSGGWFHATPNPDKQPYTIVIPPPNVTGALHLGHALNNTLQDIMIRLKRMQGFNALWMPGTDHAGIATQARVEKRIKDNEGKTRHDLGRQELVNRIFQWKEQYEARILGQLKQMGCSCDWDRTRFTLDDVCARAVRHTFFDLFKKSFIYRGKRLVNWDTYLGTTVSDDEVENKTVQGNFWHFLYPVVDPKPGEPAHVTVATTRPETMLGDTAVAVHPDPAAALSKVESELTAKLKKSGPSEIEAVELQIVALQQRRAEMLPALEQLRDMANDGRQLMLPLMDRAIPLITDVWAKPELGSGCVKITPAHDPNDYEVGQRAHLPMINIMNADGTLNAEAGKYHSLSMKQARKEVVGDLEALGLLKAVEDRDIEMPVSDRSGTPIEPYLTDQWFVKMDTLAQSAMDVVQSKEVKITPERYANGYLSWLEEKRDWPISRQLWWGHQIPVWSIPCQTDADCAAVRKKIVGLDVYSADIAAIEIESSSEPDPEKRQQLNLPDFTLHVCVQDESKELEAALESIGLVREEDVLDTWFSSALWPHSTLGWPEKTPELEHFYPTSALITSRDIITLWVARMVIMGLNNLGEVPFSSVFIHPKILDGNGQTMSKSKGNGIDPLDVIEKFGADALRFGMADLTTETQDVRLPVLYECPNEKCLHQIVQTTKNRTLTRVECPKCKQEFSTQWAESKEDLALPRGAVTSERFEVARNFTNKLWNASRFAMLNLEGYTPSPIQELDLRVEDRWILSRLVTVSINVTESLENYRFAEAARELYDFAWNHFCSFFLEILKDRFADPAQRPHAQRMLVFALDQLLKLLHPVMPFITEAIWQQLNRFAPKRGLESVESAHSHLIGASWPKLDQKWSSGEIETQFARFQSGLGSLREIRARQNLAPKKEVKFSIRCDQAYADSLSPMASYFKSMASAELTSMGPDVVAPQTNATVANDGIEMFVDLDGLIDVGAEIKRLEKEEKKTEGNIVGKEKKLSNEKFVSSAPAEIVQRERDSLAVLKEQLTTIKASLEKLRKQK